MTNRHQTSGNSAPTEKKSGQLTYNIKFTAHLLHTQNDKQTLHSGRCTVKPDTLLDMSVDVCCKTHSLQ